MAVRPGQISDHWELERISDGCMWNCEGYISVLSKVEKATPVCKAYDTKLKIT